MDPTVHTTVTAPPGAYVIPDTDTYIYYRVNNIPGTPPGSPGTIQLPHANVAGKIVVVIGVNVNTAGDNAETVYPQSGDTICSSGGCSGSGLSEQNPIQLISDGAGHWIVIPNQ